MKLHPRDATTILAMLLAFIKEASHRLQQENNESLWFSPVPSHVEEDSCCYNIALAVMNNHNIFSNNFLFFMLYGLMFEKILMRPLL